MVSRTLMGVWSAIDFLLLGAGVVSLIISVVWRAPNLLLNFVIGPHDLTAAMALGIALLITFAISLGAIVQRNHVTFGLELLNWILILDAVLILVVSGALWFTTLEGRNHFHGIYSQLPPENRILFQDQLKCCGWFNGTDLAVVGGNFCQDASFVSSITALNTSLTCVTPIMSFANETLQDVFTVSYAFTGIVLLPFLASLCVIKKRMEDERFKKIDAKRGGKGFV